MAENRNGKGFDYNAISGEIDVALSEGVPVSENILATLVGLSVRELTKLIVKKRSLGQVILQDNKMNYYLADSQEEFDRWFVMVGQPMMDLLVRMIRGMQSGSRLLPKTGKFPTFRFTEKDLFPDEGEK